MGTVAKGGRALKAVPTAPLDELARFRRYLLDKGAEGGAVVSAPGRVTKYHMAPGRFREQYTANPKAFRSFMDSITPPMEKAQVMGEHPNIFPRIFGTDPGNRAFTMQLLDTRNVPRGGGANVLPEMGDALQQSVAYPHLWGALRAKNPAVAAKSMYLPSKGGRMYHLQDLHGGNLGYDPTDARRLKAFDPMFSRVPVGRQLRLPRDLSFAAGVKPARGHALRGAIGDYFPPHMSEATSYSDLAPAAARDVSSYVKGNPVKAAVGLGGGTVGGGAAISQLNNYMKNRM